MVKIYNEEIKERYLQENYPDEEGTQNTIRNLFSKSELVEDILQKDLYNFNLVEVGKVLQNTNPYSKNVAKTHLRFLSRYISWAINTGLRDNNIHPIKGVETDWAEQFVDKTKKVHFSYDEMNEMVESMANAQDQAFIWMLFEGVQGNRFSEIRNLNYNTVNWNTNELTLMDEDGSTRTITVTDQCMRYIENAYKQTVYRGEEERERPMIMSDFIIRNTHSPRTKSPDISLSALYNRIHSLKTKLSLLYFTPNGIKQSGMIWEAVKQYQQDGVLGYKQLAIIGEKYNFSTISNNGYTYFNTYLMKDFLSSENIKELYDIDLVIDLK